MAKAKTKKTPPKERPPSLNSVVAQIMKDNGGSMRLRDVEAAARSVYEAEKREIPKRFSGMIWHALQATSIRGKEAGHYNLKTEAQLAVEAKAKAEERAARLAERRAAREAARAEAEGA